MSQSACSVEVLCKAPLPGFAKTRLLSELGPEGVVWLQTYLIRRTVKIAVSAAVGPVTLWCAPDITHPLFDELATGYHVQLQNQSAGDLGMRMSVAAEHALRESERAILIGNDCPVMTAGYLTDAAAFLDRYDTVIGPAQDGGYVLLGLKDWSPVLFTGIAWGTSCVLKETCARLERLSVSYRLLPELWDVDNRADLDRWLTLLMAR